MFKVTLCFGLCEKVVWQWWMHMSLSYTCIVCDVPPTVLRSTWLWGLLGFSSPCCLVPQSTHPYIWFSWSSGDRHPSCSQTSSTTNQGREGFSEDGLGKSCYYVDENKIGSPPTTTYEVNSRSIKDQYPKAETMGLIEVGVGDYLSDLAE